MNSRWLVPRPSSPFLSIVGKCSFVCHPDLTSFLLLVDRSVMSDLWMEFRIYWWLGLALLFGENPQAVAYSAQPLFWSGWEKSSPTTHSQWSSTERWSRNTPRVVAARVFYVLRGLLASQYRTVRRGMQLYIGWCSEVLETFNSYSLIIS